MFRVLSVRQQDIIADIGKVQNMTATACMPLTQPTLCSIDDKDVRTGQ